MPGDLMNLYNRAPLAFERGEGCRLYDASGEAYLDCVAGIATNALGHGHPLLKQALYDQAEKLWHVSNIFASPGQEALAARLTASCFADEVFFCTTGTEAVEAALKLARRHHFAKGSPERIDVIGFSGSFHGRTYGAVNASGAPSYLEGFGPRLPGYVRLELGDWPGIEAAIASPTTAAVIVEPVQGEGGAVALPGETLQRLRRLCTSAGVLLIYDEVQCGMGRTGVLFAHQAFADAAPDAMTLAKALGGGFPVAACLATRDAACGMAPGVHGTTFGGNPLGMAVAMAALDAISAPQMLAHVREVSAHLRGRLQALMARFPGEVLEVRGAGLLLGVKLATNNRVVMAAARERRLLVAGGGDNCIRLLPPLIITREEADEAVTRLGDALADLVVNRAAAARKEAA